MPVYIITGANRGIGLEYVRQISSTAQPKTIIATVRSLSGDHADLKALCPKLSRDSQVHILECDTASILSIHSFADKVKSIVSERGKIDVLVNNAGINAVPEQDSLSMEPADLQHHININVIGPAGIVKLLSPCLGAGSVVVNMTSGLGSCGKGTVKCTTYAISKAALNMLTVHQAGDLAEKGVRVVCLDPGWVKTRMGGDGAMVEAEESVGGMLDIVTKVREGQDGGELGTAKFYLYDGSEVPW